MNNRTLTCGIGFVVIAFLVGCGSTPKREYDGIDRTFTDNMARIAVMPFGPHVQPANQAAGTQATGTAGATGAGGAAAGGATTGAAGAGTPAGAGGLVSLIGQTALTSTKDAQLLSAAVESELVRVGKERFDVIEREKFMLLLREKQMNDTEFKDQSALNLMELGEKVGVDAYLTGAIDTLAQLGKGGKWELTARMKVIDTRSAKVWYNEIFVAHGRDRPEAVRKWAKLVGKALTQERFAVPFNY